MARHSHWHNIQLTKGKADAKKAQVFSKLARAITLAAKVGGGDVNFNFKLRVAVDSAKAVSMPKDNIERAIARGTGSGDGVALEEIVYEGFAPGGVAMLVQCVSDNRNRTVAEVKNIVTKRGGSIGASGSVMWMFEKKGVVTIMDTSSILDRDSFDLAMIEVGADDIVTMDEGIQILCEPKNLKLVVDAVETRSLKVDGAGLEYVAKNTVKVEDAEIENQIVDLIDALEAYDDVDAVFTNEV